MADVSTPVTLSHVSVESPTAVPTGRCCVVIPVYNAAHVIGPVVQHITRLGFDTIVVNDGSTDGTAQVASHAGALVMSHVVNRGKGASLRTGFAFALRTGYDIVVTMDGDGQHDPAEIPRLLGAATQGQHVIVIGDRVMNRAVMPRVRRWTNRVMSRVVSRLAKQRIPDSQCGFRAIPRQVLATVQLSASHFDLETELLLAAARNGWTITSVPVRTIYDHHASHIHPLWDGLRFIRLVCRYVMAPPWGCGR